MLRPIPAFSGFTTNFLALAKTFESEIVLEKDGQRADGKSIMKVMLLAAPVGSEVALQVAGADEDAAFDAVRALIDDGFGELG